MAPPAASSSAEQDWYLQLEKRCVMYKYTSHILHLYSILNIHTYLCSVIQVIYKNARHYIQTIDYTH